MERHNPRLPIRIDDRNRRIIELIFEYRFLSTPMLQSLVCVYPESENQGNFRESTKGFGEKALYKRLRTLYVAGYLTRYYLSDLPLGRGIGAPRAIYALGPKAVELASQYSGIDTAIIRRRVEANAVQSPYLRHALAITQFRILVERSCQKSGRNARLVYWKQGQQLRDSVTVHNKHGERHRYSVYPDAVLGIEKNGTVSNYFLEIDRQTVPIWSESRTNDIRRKLKGLYYYRKLKRFQDRYFHTVASNGSVVGLHLDRRNVAGAVPQHGRVKAIPGFTVLYIITHDRKGTRSTAGRIESIMNVLPKISTGISTTSMFWFGEVPTDGLLKYKSVDDILWRGMKPLSHRLCR